MPSLIPPRPLADKSRFKLQGGITALRKIPLSELKQHKTQEDAWSVFNGKVYNITPYLRFHPGGVPELMRVAGRDGTKLFSELSFAIL